MTRLAFILLLGCILVAEERPIDVIDEILVEWIEERKSRLVISETGLNIMKADGGIEKEKRIDVGVVHPNELELANRLFMEELLLLDNWRLKALFVQGRVMSDYNLSKDTLDRIKGKPENQEVLRLDYWEERHSRDVKRVLAVRDILKETSN